VRNATQGKVPCDGKSAHGRVPRQRATAEGLPTQRESAKDPATERKSSDCKQSDCRAAPRHQTNRDPADAHRCNGQTTESEEQTIGKITRCDPRLDRPTLAPASGFIDFHDTTPPPDHAFYRTVQP